MGYAKLGLLCLICPCLATAVQLPAPAGEDPYIRYADYRADQVTLILVQRGTATRIVLEHDEHILGEGAGTGYSPDCGKPEYAWCMRADQGDNQILVRPKENATANNLELRTDKRDYSFRFEVLSDADGSGSNKHRGGGVATGARQQPMYRVIFRYPQAAVSARVAAAAHAEPPPGADRLLREARPTPRNWRYSMQAMPGSDDIVPALAFDDGRFTYLQFPADREMPTVYLVSPAGEETRVNFHIDEHDPGLLVIERLGHRFVLRLGRAAVGVWNESYQADGAPPAGGTTVPGVARELR